jgi:hypothetical protein
MTRDAFRCPVCKRVHSNQRNLDAHKCPGPSEDGPAPADLAAWLLEQITEDEKIAQQASGEEPGTGPDGGEHWHWVHTEEPLVDQPVDLADDDDPPFRTDLRSVERYPTTTVGPLPHFAVAYSEEVEHRVARHIVTWDPARVLAECDAKRRIALRHTPQIIGRPPHPICTYCSAVPDAVDWPCPELRDVLAPYQDRPGYREEWKP